MSALGLRSWPSLGAEVRRFRPEGAKHKEMGSDGILSLSIHTYIHVRYLFLFFDSSKGENRILAIPESSVRSGKVGSERGKVGSQRGAQLRRSAFVSLLRMARERGNGITQLLFLFCLMQGVARGAQNGSRTWKIRTHIISDALVAKMHVILEFALTLAHGDYRHRAAVVRRAVRHWLWERRALCHWLVNIICVYVYLCVYIYICIHIRIYDVYNSVYPAPRGSRRAPEPLQFRTIKGR